MKITFIFVNIVDTLVHTTKYLIKTLGLQGGPAILTFWH